MGRLFSIILISGLLALVSCSRNTENSTSGCYSNGTDRDVICDLNRGYTFYQPKWVNATDWKERNMNITTYDFPLSLQEQNEWASSGYYLPREITCSPFFTGASVMAMLSAANGKAEWGRVDHFDNEKMGEFETDDQKPICIPPTNKGAAGYALCTEKDGKTVLICISQIKDDPKMAQQIFETFRWVK